MMSACCPPDLPEAAIGQTLFSSTCSFEQIVRLPLWRLRRVAPREKTSSLGALDHDQPHGRTATRPGAHLAPWSDAIPFGRLAG